MIFREYSPLCFVCLVCRAIRLVDTLQNKGVVIGVWHFERETVGLFRSEARFCKENAIKGFEIAVKNRAKIAKGLCGFENFSYL